MRNRLFLRCWRIKRRRHAIVAAARIPEAFGGLLIGNPGFNLTQAAIQLASGVQEFKFVNLDVTSAYSREDLTLVSGAILSACDGWMGSTMVSSTQQTNVRRQLMLPAWYVQATLSRDV